MEALKKAKEKVEDVIDEYGEKIYDFFDKRISKVLFIKSFAIENRISYTKAKKIYKQRYSEQSQIIRRIAQENQVPYELIISMIEDDKLSFEQLTYYNINKKIYQDFFKDEVKNKDLLLIKDYTGYIEEIRRRLGAAVLPKTIPDIIDEIQRDIYKFAQKNNVSSAVATLCVCYDSKILEAQKIVKFLTYNERHNIESSNSIAIDFVKYLNANSDFKKITLHGITIISQTQERLDRLIEIVEKAFSNGNEEYKKQLEQLAKEKNLVLTDHHFSEDSEWAFHNNSSRLIYINLNLNQDLVNVFYHESSHFIDSKSGVNNYYFSIVEDKVWNLFKKLEEKTNGEPYESVINNPKIPHALRNIVNSYANAFRKGVNEKGKEYKTKTINLLASSYIYNHAMTEKWKREIEEQYEPETAEEAFDYLVQKRRYEREKYIRLIGNIYDIYDAIAKGRLHDKYYTDGHGRDYFSSNRNRLVEFIAQIGVFYNNNCMDVLIYEFGEEIAFELIDIYKDLLQRSQEINDAKQTAEQKAELNAMLEESEQENNTKDINRSK